MKPIAKSRLVWVLAAVVAAQLALYLRRYLPADQAALLSDELVATLCAALGIGGIGLRVQDKKRARDARGMLSEQQEAAIKRAVKAAKAAGKLGAGLAFALLCGCSPTWQLCEVDLSNHPTKPRPAAQATVRCSRTVLCDVAEGARCDGKALAEVGK